MSDRTERAVDAAYAAINNVLGYSAGIEEYARAAARAVLAEIDAECASERDALRAENATLIAEAAVMEAAANALVAAVTHEREMVCQDFGMQQSASEDVDQALTACRALTTSQEGKG